jgi:rhamnogalacturonan endolyase
MSSGHQDGTRPNITHGFDRTYGPQYHHFNKGGNISKSYADAAQYANSSWNAEFYDSIAKYVPNYVPSSHRTNFKAKIKLPRTAKRPIAILSESGRYFQDNVERMDALQYWAEIDPATGLVEIPRVKEDIYWLTVYADGVFGMFVEEDVEVSRRNHKGQGQLLTFRWEAESAGKEIWIPILAPLALEKDTNLANMYWSLSMQAMWDFPTKFPNGVTYKVGESNPSQDWNYIHWSVFSHVGNVFRNETVYGINNWTILFDLDTHQLAHGQGNLKDKTTTLTISFAGAKTGSRTNDWVNLPYTLNVNGDDVETWIVPWSVSTSCGVRSAASCLNFEHKFRFRAERLRLGENRFVLSLPRDAASVEEAALPWTTYVQYDALRLEIG